MVVEQICAGRVVVITGAGRGIGREYALEFARRGASVVVNDLGAAVDGAGSSGGPAEAVVEEIRALGGAAIADNSDVADWDGAQNLVRTAIEVFGKLDVVVNNAGILRDRAIVNMSAEEWDQVIRVHLRGTFAVMHHAARHWRTLAKTSGPVDARVINTSSASGLFGNVGQSNYGAAKAAIAGLTIIGSQELSRYGVTVNAVYPSAYSRLTANIGVYRDDPDKVEERDPAHVAPLVVWLGSSLSNHVTGRVFGTQGHTITLAEAWRAGPRAIVPVPWTPEAMDALVNGLLSEGAPNVDIYGDPIVEPIRSLGSTT